MRQWTMYLVQHSHIDVGFTERQEIIADYQRQFISQAVEMALSPRQATRDDATRFRFTCEGFWAVEQFLARATPVQQAQLLATLRSGDMELTGCYFHLNELLDQGHLAESLRPARDFADKHGLPLSVAMGADINGFSWGMADAMVDAGLRYLSMNINVHDGGTPLNRTQFPFYWESPRGQRLLVWVGLVYHTANLLGLVPGYHPDIVPGVPGLKVEASGKAVDVQDLSMAERKVFPMLEMMEASGYPYDFLLVMGSGAYTDNSPPSETICAQLQRWNARHGDRVQIRTTTLATFFSQLEAHAADIPTYRGDWTDWWSDGTISTPQETKIFREAQRTKRLVEMMDPEHAVVSEERLRRISEQLIMYAEHTWGHSVTYSPSLLTQRLSLSKGKFAVTADELATSALQDVLSARGKGPFTARRPFVFTIHNPLPVRRRGIISIPLDFWETPFMTQGFRIVDGSGRIYPHQVMDTVLKVVGISIELEGRESREITLEPADTTDADVPAPPADGVYENAFYRLCWSAERGIHSLVSKATGSDLLSAGTLGLGGPIYQLFPGADRWQAGGFHHAPRTIPPSEITPGTVTAVTVDEHGPVYTGLCLAYQVPGGTYQTRVRLYHDLPHFDLSVDLHKDDVTDPEGMYAAFPVALEGGTWYLDKPGAAVRPGRDQLPGTCTDYYMVQNGVVLVGTHEGMVIAMPDTPMVHIGQLRLWQYTTAIDPTGPLYSWLTNNKWCTNFRISCGGRYEFRYTIDINPSYADHERALQACAAHNVPILVMRK